MYHGCNLYVHVRVGQEKCPNVCRTRPRSGFDGVRYVFREGVGSPAKIQPRESR